MHEEYRRYQQIEQDLLTKIQDAEHGLSQLSLLQTGQQQQQLLESLHALHAEIRAAIFIAEELLTAAQLRRLQRRVNVHDPHRWQHYRDYKSPL